MNELRVDPLTGLRSVVAPYSPLLTPGAEEPAPQAERDLYTAFAARGRHERIPLPAPLTSLDAGALAAAVEIWRDRMRALAADAAALHLSAAHPGLAPAAGGPAVAGPPHAELFALDFVPALLARERERFSAYAVRTMGGNLLGDLVQAEVRKRERVVAIDDEAVCLAAWAPRRPYHLLIVPRRTRARFEDAGTASGAAMLHDALRRVTAHLGNAAPHVWVRTAPQGAEHYCWRIDVLPAWAEAPLALGTGVEVCDVAPEQAAAELRAH